MMSANLGLIWGSSSQLSIARVQFLGAVEFTLALTLKPVGHTSQMLYFFLKAPLIRSGPPVYSFIIVERQLIFKQIAWYPLIFTGSSYTQRKEGHIQNRNISGWNLGSPRRVLPSVITDKCVINKMCIVNRQ